MNRIQTETQAPFEIRSVMDILYGEGSRDMDGAFICANDGKKRAQDNELIHLSDKDIDYSTFWSK